MMKAVFILAILIGAALAAPQPPRTKTDEQKPQAGSDEKPAEHKPAEHKPEKDQKPTTEQHEQLKKTGIESRRCVKNPSECHKDETVVDDHQKFCHEEEQKWYCSVFQKPQRDCKCTTVDECSKDDNKNDHFQLDLADEELKCSLDDEGRQTYACCKVPAAKSEEDEKDNKPDHQAKPEPAKLPVHPDVEDRKKRQAPEGEAAVPQTADLQSQAIPEPENKDCSCFDHDADCASLQLESGDDAFCQAHDLNEEPGKQCCKSGTKTKRQAPDTKRRQPAVQGDHSAKTDEETTSHSQDEKNNQEDKNAQHKPEIQVQEKRPEQGEDSQPAQSHDGTIQRKPIIRPSIQRTEPEKEHNQQQTAEHEVKPVVGQNTEAKKDENEDDDHDDD